MSKKTDTAAHKSQLRIKCRLYVFILPPRRQNINPVISLSFHALQREVKLEFSDDLLKQIVAGARDWELRAVGAMRFPCDPCNALARHCL